MKTLKAFLIPISIIVMASCAQTQKDVPDDTSNMTNNAAKPDSVPLATKDTGMTLQKEKLQYDTMMSNTIDSMRAMLKEMDSHYHKMKLTDIDKWEVQKAAFSNRIEMLQKKDDELHTSAQIDWVNFKMQSDTAIYNLNHALNEKMKEMNLK